MENKYKSLGQFRKDYLSEYSHLHYKGLLVKLCEDMGWNLPRNPHGYWTKERCMEEGLKYSTITEWRNKSLPSYNMAKKQKWLDDCTNHMLIINPNVYWTKERCMESALKYTIKSTWVKDNLTCVRISKLNGWFDECIAHMEVTSIPSSYWTKERCIEDSLKYTTKKEWKNKSNGSYRVSCKNKWVGELSTHMVEGCKPPNYWTKERCIEEALKHNIKEHWKKQHPPSYQASLRNGWYNELTTHMIESTKPNGYWTKERCIENAKKFTTISDWSKANSTPVTNARANGWYDECTAHMFRVNKPANYWNNKKRCMEEALKYTLISDWANGSSASYTQARKNGWYDECITHMKNQRIRLDSWTKELCHAEALKYKTKNEWIKNNNNSYRAARANGWYDEFITHMVVLKVKESYWTKELCHVEALKYTTRNEWRRNGFSSYKTAKTNGWLDECCTHIVKYKKPSKWTLSKCLEYSLKFKTKMEWKNNHSPSYHAAQKFGWSDECTTHMSGINSKPKRYWTLERCMEEALKYNKKIDWVNSKTSYQAARVNGWIAKCTAHMIDRKLTKEHCMKEALKHKTRKEWKSNSNSTYNSAYKNGWCDECTAHMVRLQKPTGYWTLERCLEEALKYTTKAEWAKSHPSSHSCSKKNGLYNECTKHMKRHGK